MSHPVSLAALVLAFALTACSGTSATQPTDDQTTQFAPVTSPELSTTTTSAQPSSTRRVTTIAETVPPDSTQEDGDGGSDGDPNVDTELPDHPLDAALLNMTSALGPTANITETLAAVLAFPIPISTPRNASVVEVNVGIGSLLPLSDAASARPPTEVVVQVSATMETTASAENTMQLLGSSLRQAGLLPTDSSSNEGAAASRSFRILDAGRFDEIVITAVDQANGADSSSGSIVRVSYNGTTSKAAADPYQRWSVDSQLLPASDQTRTILSLVRSGEGQLRTTTFRVESASIVAGDRAQREADRLVRRIAQTAAADDTSAPRFELLNTYDDGISAPLEDGLRYPGLDEAGYEVVPIQQIDIDEEGELELVDAIEVRLTGSRLID
ncbi:MAG: hypothetical protein HKN03_02900 [Acidimicrobiales bacterium]|nr:hypothetical protein [Acidimicrobiales bacterium]